MPKPIFTILITSNYCETNQHKLYAKAECRCEIINVSFCCMHHAKKTRRASRRWEATATIGDIKLTL